MRKKSEYSTIYSGWMHKYANMHGYSHFCEYFSGNAFIFNHYIIYKEVPQPKDCGTKGDIMILIPADFTAETKD